MSEVNPSPSLIDRIRRGLSGPKKLEIPLSAYGKLPFYKDFLRIRAGKGPAGRLRQWLDEGISRYWANDEGCRDHELGAHAFILDLGDGPIAGLLWGSHDSGGLRRFPFALGVEMPSPRGAFGRPSLIDALTQIVDAAQAMRSRIATLSSADELYATIRNASIRISMRRSSEVVDELRTRLDETTVGDYAESLYGDQAPKLWPGLVAFLERARTDAAAQRLAVRLPGSDALPLVTQAHWWQALIEGSLELGASRAPSLLLPICDPGAGITILARPPRPDDAFLLHPAKHGYDFVEDLRERVPSPADPPPSLDDESASKSLLSLIKARS